ncbi:MAG: GldG family protein [Anaerovoracaceae bacterium]
MLKNKMKNLYTGVRATMRKKGFRMGTYTAGTTAVVLVILVIINMCVSAIPSKYTQLDLSSGSLYSVGNQTENAVKSLEQEVKIYWLVQEGQEDMTVEKLLENYEDLSSKVTVEKVDPVVYPNFAYQYTSSGVYNNSIVVTNADETKSRYISYYDIYETSYDENYNEQTAFDGEGEITSAINYVTNEVQSDVYYLTGHGEDSIPDNMVTAIQKANLNLNSLSLLTNDEIPKDCSVLIIYSPEKDLSDKDREKVEEYLSTGGKMLLITDCSDESFSNLHGIMGEYGIEAVDGMVIEGDTNYCLSSYANYLVPEIESHEITDELAYGNYFVIMPMAQGLEINDSGENEYLTVEPLLTTSDTAFSKIAGVNSRTAEKEDGDIDSDGGFALAAAVSEYVDDGETRIVWLTSSYLLDEQINSMSSGANMQFITSAVGWMTGEEETISISAKTVSSEYLTLTGAQSSRWTFVMVIIVPLVFIIYGIAVWARRRKL